MLFHSTENKTKCTNSAIVIVVSFLLKNGLRWPKAINNDNFLQLPKQIDWSHSHFINLSVELAFVIGRNHHLLQFDSSGIYSLKTRKMINWIVASRTTFLMAKWTGTTIFGYVAKLKPSNCHNGWIQSAERNFRFVWLYISNGTLFESMDSELN